jgi:hypothetical protein
MDYVEATALLEKEKCCENAMDLDYDYVNGEDHITATCLTCGAFISIAIGQLDTDEMDMMKEEEG